MSDTQPDALFTHQEWAKFCERVAAKLGPDVAPEDVIDLARELSPGRIFEFDYLRQWAYTNL